jgi:hypothetical protein
MAKRARTIVARSEAQLKREFAAEITMLKEAHAAELEERDKKRAEAIARKDDRIAQMSAEQQAVERNSCCSRPATPRWTRSRR